jgi:hypothetical protein
MLCIRHKADQYVQEGRGQAKWTLGAPNSSNGHGQTTMKKSAKGKHSSLFNPEEKSSSNITSTPESSEGLAQSKFFGFGVGWEPWRRAAAAATGAALRLHRGTRTGEASGTWHGGFAENPPHCELKWNEWKLLHCGTLTFCMKDLSITTLSIGLNRTMTKSMPTFSMKRLSPC